MTQEGQTGEHSSVGRIRDCRTHLVFSSMVRVSEFNWAMMASFSAGSTDRTATQTDQSERADEPIA